MPEQLGQLARRIQIPNRRVSTPGNAIVPRAPFITTPYIIELANALQKQLQGDSMLPPCVPGLFQDAHPTEQRCIGIQSE
jgi:hypothetical protein